MTPKDTELHCLFGKYRAHLFCVSLVCMWITEGWQESFLFCPTSNKP